MAFQSDTKTDTVVLLFSTLAVLIAAFLSMATITAGTQSAPMMDTSNPTERAEMAADAGVEAAKWHIECHGRTGAGSLSPRYFVNGATYTVEWDDVNFGDSTVIIRSSGDFSWGDDKHFKVDLESKIKLDFFPVHDQEILENYYSRR